MLRVFCRVQHRQKRAPRIAEQTHFIDPDEASHRIDIFDVDRNRRGSSPHLAASGRLRADRKK